MTVESLAAQLAAFHPGCPQEEADRAEMLCFLQTHKKALLREDETGHFTASAWIVDPARERVLMAYHNIYRAWTWIGGHADGDADLMRVALRETLEETGAVGAHPVVPDIFFCGDPTGTGPYAAWRLCTGTHAFECNLSAGGGTGRAATGKAR